MALLRKDISTCPIPNSTLTRLALASSLAVIAIFTIWFTLEDTTYGVQLARYKQAQTLKYFKSSQVSTVLSDAQDALRKPKIILYWTIFYGDAEFGVGYGDLPFTKAGCINRSTQKCFTTSDRSWFNFSDAVIFHFNDLNASDLPPASWRQPQQKFIFFNLEPPNDIDLAPLRHLKNYFNWTMTYRRDSDVVNSYGQLKCIDPGRSSCQCLPISARCSATGYSKPSGDLTLPALNNTKRWSGKKKAVAWFVSNCFTKSARELLVERLMEYIDVDIYGRCPGTLKCWDRTKCDEMMRENYRFYLSFENSLCPDYITEKLYKAMAYDTIPVVYGGADYSHYIPPGSYINAKDYPSARALAEHLKEIMANEETYSSYFHWQSTYTVDRRVMQGWCNLCDLLHDESVGHKTYPDIFEWWNGTPNNPTCTVISR